MQPVRHKSKGTHLQISNKQKQTKSQQKKRSKSTSSGNVLDILNDIKSNSNIFEALHSNIFKETVRIEYCNRKIKVNNK